ncbi:hypothetical protein GQ600_14028 [Phytophthora cactorum]|nr:hypothetical protein GQ600_14028 [Phytophthora cactorum]
MAARNGRFEIVKFLNEKCGEEFFREDGEERRRRQCDSEDEEDEVFRIDCPLASAVNVASSILPSICTPITATGLHI